MTAVRRVPRRWPLWLIAAPAAVAIWSGWVGLGELCGFGILQPLPCIWDALRLNTAITLPVGVEVYGAYALGAWLTPGVPATVRTFARRSAIGALALGMLGQVVYHLLVAAHAHSAPWPVVVLVSCLPVVTLGFGAVLTHLLRVPGEAAEASETGLGTEGGRPEVLPEPAIPDSVMPDSVIPAVATSAREAALLAYAASVRGGNPLSGRALERQFGISRNEAAKVRSEVAAMNGRSTPGEPAPPAVMGGQATGRKVRQEVRAASNGHASSEGPGEH